MEHNDKSHALPYAQQQIKHIWAEGTSDNGHFTESTSFALASVGLGPAAEYLKTHPEYLMAALNDSNWETRAAAVQMLEQQRDPAPLKHLLNALHDEHVSVRAMAVRAMGHQEMHVPIEPLLMALNDPEWRVRTGVLLALGRCSNKTPVEPLLASMSDEHPSVRAAAVWALGKLGKQVPVEHLVMALQDEAWSVRQAAVMALHEQGKRAPLAPLLAARWDEDSSVRQTTETVLGYRYDDVPGQKLLPKTQERSEGTHSSFLSWLHLVVAVLSALAPVPLTVGLFGDSGYISHFDSISHIIALGVACLTIMVIMIIYRWKLFRRWSGRQSTRSGSSKLGLSLQTAVLALVSMGIVGALASTLLNAPLPYKQDITPEIINFVLTCRLIALGLVALTITAINLLFHWKRS